MSLNDWIKALHILSAFALVGALTMFWLGYLVLRGNGGGTAALGRFFTVGSVAIGIGMAGTLVFGIWLSISLEGYDPWDGWVIAALVLWLIGGAVGDRAGRLSRQPGGVQRAVVLHAVTTLAVLLILIDMIWKPGA